MPKKPQIISDVIHALTELTVYRRYKHPTSFKLMFATSLIELITMLTLMRLVDL